MQKITTHLWYDREAREAAEFYVSIFPRSKVTSLYTLHDTPSGSADVVAFELMGREFQALSAGPEFKLNPSVSFQATFRTAGEVDAVWAKLSPGGQVLMELGAYPFSERFGWVQDRYGLSWQIFAADGESKITPFIMFVGDVCGRAEEAINFWTSVFPDAEIEFLQHYGQSEGPDREGTLMRGAFSLCGLGFGAMDSAYDHRFAFNEAISFMVKCDDQEEIDYYWSKLSAVPEAEVCGWLKDSYGLSWQIIPRELDGMLRGGDAAQTARVTEAFLKMTKFDLAALREAYAGG